MVIFCWYIVFFRAGLIINLPFLGEGGKEDYDVMIETSGDAVKEAKVTPAPKLATVKVRLVC